MAVTVDVELQVGRRMEEGRLLKVKEKGNDAVVPRRGNDAKRRIRSVRIARAKIETVRGQDSYTEGQLSLRLGYTYASVGPRVHEPPPYPVAP